jgi:tetratricopeptide (TPR) repeat protein
MPVEVHTFATVPAIVVCRGGVACPARGVVTLVEESRRLRYSAPDESLDAARHAYRLAAAGRVTDDVRAGAAAEAGNASRRFGRWREAADLLDEAERLVTDRLLLARIASYRGSLHSARREWWAAHQALDRAAALYGDDRAGLVTVAIQRGIAWIEAGEPRRARRPLGEAFRDAPDLDLRRFAAQPWTWAVLESCGPAEAQRVYSRLDVFLESPEAGELYRQRVAWLRGKIALAAGDYDRARDELRPLRSAFAGTGLIQEAALVCLDLTRVEAGAGRPFAAGAMLGEARPLLAALGLGRDALVGELVQRAAGEPLAVALVLDVERRVRALPSYRRA